MSSVLLEVRRIDVQTLALAVSRPQKHRYAVTEQSVSAPKSAMDLGTRIFERTDELVVIVTTDEGVTRLTVRLIDPNASRLRLGSRLLAGIGRQRPCRNQHRKTDSHRNPFNHLLGALPPEMDGRKRVARGSSQEVNGPTLADGRPKVVLSGKGTRRGEMFSSEFFNV